MMIYAEQADITARPSSPPLKSLFMRPLKLRMERVTSRAEVNLFFLTASLDEPQPACASVHVYDWVTATKKVR